MVVDITSVAVIVVACGGSGGNADGCVLSRLDTLLCAATDVLVDICTGCATVTFRVADADD